MICTSYFSSKAPRERKVCIAKWPPRYWSGPRARLFAPEDPRAVNWRAAYRKNLESRFPTPESLERYLGSVLALTPEPNPVLLRGRRLAMPPANPGQLSQGDAGPGCARMEGDLAGAGEPALKRRWG